MTDKEIFERVRELLKANMEEGVAEGDISFHFTRPSPSRYPYQFFWDTCFHVFIFSALGDHDMAKKHVESLFALQSEDGFVGHMIYWDRLKPGRMTDFFQSLPRFQNFYQSHMSALIQPPLIAQAVERIFKDSGDKEFLRKMLPKLKKYYHWLATHRDFQGDKLLTIISPFESGMDWKPSYDIPLKYGPKLANSKLFRKVVSVDLRNFIHNYDLKKIYKKGYFLVKDVAVNTIYAQNLRAMATLCEAVGEDGAYYQDLADKVTASMMKLMYNKEDAAFYDCYGKDNKQIKVLTPTIFYPVVLNTIPSEITEEVMDRHFFNGNEFKARYPIPSVAKNESSFDPLESIFIWRGPTWITNNWFLHKFFIDRGYNDEATNLVNSIKKLIRKSGFREYYNPFTGEGYGAHNFTWAGLVCDMMEMEKQNPNTKRTQS
ncbi:amylo-alpha-1,6-glucosidase [Salinimicrobium soli]|uniref:amylo-alpha-1,6-glucosidase n=1 Tax=Salinimicrobium soli TaxID=1254399 RepID=UPI003AADC317